MESCSILVECVDSEKLSLLYGKAVRILHNWMLDNQKKIGCIYYTSDNEAVPTKWFDPNDDRPTQFDIVFLEFCPLGLSHMREPIVRRTRDTLKLGGHIMIPYFALIDTVFEEIKQNTEYNYVQTDTITAEIARNMMTQRQPWAIIEKDFIVYQKQIQLRW